MRTITNHAVEEDPCSQLTIMVTDKAEEGGACRNYMITWPLKLDLDGVRKWGINIIEFQSGPVAQNGLNGVTNEALLAIVIDRLRGFQSGPHPSSFNDCALRRCEQALDALQERARNQFVPRAYFLVYPPDLLDYQRRGDPPPDRSGMAEEARQWAAQFGWKESEEDGMWISTFSDVRDGKYTVVGFRLTAPWEMVERARQLTRQLP